MSMFFPLMRPLLFRLDAERVHGMTVAALKRAPTGPVPASDPVLRSDVAGLTFANPVGLAAGFDKNAEVPAAMLGLGFGFVEVGTLTPRPQSGNPRPRIFRLPKDRAVINRLGFNNGGLDRALARLSRRQPGTGAGMLGINVGANKDSEDRIADYEVGVRRAAPLADYLTVNISSPNTPGLRALQSKDALAELLERSLAARGGRAIPLFVKVAPDLSDSDVADIAEVALASGVSGLICSNTTIARPDALRSDRRAEEGGLSGRPLKARALDRLIAFRQATGGRLPLIGVGGIETAEDAYARIRAGASLVQLYTALVYEGPRLPRRLAAGLAKHVKADGFASVAEAVGADAR
ncbi:quinone-dependent dihydroorotate dehydrogenase [Pacificimonas flava]|uniref:Dihydroorotate dehydrogenase (quinone) n=1 Tax=Pacificimonas flava TaxID=1234595 RepID=M2U6D1_9SPHN|nr:Dihydroorotate dehydrogenase [Pacificimonas flava]MBB5278891.1 dihydroorotate dehydrogenase [Pacificimonas flava]